MNDTKDKDNPDKKIESFWLNLKRSLINDIKVNTKPIIDDKLLDKWSDDLNQLQKEKKYLEIENKIYQYLIIMASIHLINYNHYTYSILMTNIKRWNRIASQKYQINKSINWSPNLEENKSLWGYLIEIGNLISRKNNNIIINDIVSIFKSYELDLDTSYEQQLMILDEIMNYSLNNRLHIFIDMFTEDKLFKLNDLIKKKYNIIIYKGIKANKLFKMIDGS